MGQEPESFYDEYGLEEWERSEKEFLASIEHENTKEYLKKHLPDEGHVLDAGGGSGKYAVWLAERGYKVTLIDLSQKQVEIARKKVSEKGLEEKITAKEGDIRDIDFETEKFDAVLCLGGPISHVMESEGREQAASELARVAKNGSNIFVSVMSFYALLLIAVPKQWGFIWNIEDFIQRQKYDREYREKSGESEASFAETYFFKEEQFRDLLERQGLEVEKIVGLENVSSVLDGKDDLDLGEDYREKLRQTANLLKEEAPPDISSHMLAIAQKDK